VSGYDDLMRVAADLTRAAASAQYKAPMVVAKSAADLEAAMKRNIVEMGAVDTGFMLGSVGTDLDLVNASAVVGPTAAYAPFVNWGTHRMPPRPFADMAADEVFPAFVSAIEALGGDIL
jgi:HK97 gp10 family phage protein